MKDVIEQNIPERLPAASIEGYAPLPVVATPATLLQMAVEQGADIDKLEKLMALQERYETNEARKAYTVALSAFKASAPVLTKNKLVSFDTSKGKTEYKHATLDNVADILGKALSEHGLSFTWKTSQGEGGQITVTCILTHIMGHSESTALSSSPDASGGKNNIQAVGSTITYLERYTLRAITGTAEAESDDDGKASEPVELITDEQVLTLESLITDNDLDMNRVKNWMSKSVKVSEFAELNAVGYEHVMKMVQSQVKAATK